MGRTQFNAGTNTEWSLKLLFHLIDSIKKDTISVPFLISSQASKIVSLDMGRMDIETMQGILE
jgi:hypothetical protein